MPSTINVKINTITPSTRGDKNGNEIAGYDTTNNKTYKTFVFELKQDGSPTVAGQVVNTLSPGDWIECTVDDTKWKNIQNLKKISQPAGAQAPTSGGASSGGGNNRSSGGGGKADGMSKEEWALKDLKKEISISRQSALKAAVNSCAADGKTVTKAKMEQIEKMSLRMEAFLLTGAFDGDVSTAAAVADTPKPQTETPASTEGPTSGPGDDDIPF